MPLYDWSCPKCGGSFESIQKSNVREIACPKCGVMAWRIISVGRPYDSTTDAPWIKSVTDVVGTETREGLEFKRNPTRANYQAWMKAKGLRPMEPGERPERPSQPSEQALAEATYRQYQRRNRLEVR